MDCRTSRVALTVSAWFSSREDVFKAQEVFEMALMFDRRLAMPVWPIAFFTVALTATVPLMPPGAMLGIALAGIAVITLAMPGACPWLPTSRSLAPVKPSTGKGCAARGIAARSPATR